MTVLSDAARPMPAAPALSSPPLPSPIPSLPADTFLPDDLHGWRGHLRREGYAVIRGAIPRERAAQYVEGMWGIMEALGTVRRDQPAGWRRSGSWPAMLHGGMIQYLGHTQLQWEARAECAPIFARYYGCAPESLATSFDGLCFMHGARRYQRAGDLVGFLHTDQSPLRRGEWSIQGLLSVADGGPEDGGLVVVPGSHLEHEAFFLDHPAGGRHPAGGQKGDWYLLTERERARYSDRARKVCMEAGDLALWDSRALHCNAVPTRAGAIRACVYACMLPQERVSAAVRAKRRQAWIDRRVSCHHPGDGFRLFPVLPRFVLPPAEEGGRDGFLRKTLDLQQPTLTPLMEALRCDQ